MLKEMSKFQLILLGLFVVFIMAGLVTFATFKGKDKTIPTVKVWGTLDSTLFNTFTKKAISTNGNNVNIIYVQKRPENFDADLLEALAVNEGPDIILVNQASILKKSNKITTIPYKAYPQANFNNFIQESELFLTPNGAMAIPFTIDPMVMYWNRDMFTNANISLPPKYWDEFKADAPKLTQRNGVASITQSAVALGEYQNISHAKDIINLLMLQAGNPLSELTTDGYESTFASGFNYAISPADAALTFYTQFADPLKEVYSWNRSLPDSKLMFYSNKLGIYFGYASEYNELKLKNPNLNYSVTYVPQPRPQTGAQTVATTYGNLYGFSILRSSRQQQNALNTIMLLTTKTNLALWAGYSDTPAVRRDAISADPSDAPSTVFATSALWSRAWLDPNEDATDDIYKTMVESITSGRSLINDAVYAAQGRIQDQFTSVNAKNK